MADAHMTIKPFSASFTDGIRIAGHVVNGSEEPFRILFTDGQHRYAIRFDREGRLVGTSVEFNEPRLAFGPQPIGGTDG